MPQHLDGHCIGFRGLRADLVVVNSRRGVHFDERAAAFGE